MTTTTMISVYLNTWKNYNTQGAAGGFWVDLPCDLDNAMKQLAKTTGENISEMEVFINDYETEINGLVISELDNIKEVNEFAKGMESLDEFDREKVIAIIEGYSESLRDAVNNIDDYTYYGGMTLEDVAYELVDDYNLPEFAKLYFDYEAFARDLELDGYHETSNGVICI